MDIANRIKMMIIPIIRLLPTRNSVLFYHNTIYLRSIKLNVKERQHTLAPNLTDVIILQIKKCKQEYERNYHN